jgi:hypothetical protein
MWRVLRGRLQAASLKAASLRPQAAGCEFLVDGINFGLLTNLVLDHHSVAGEIVDGAGLVIEIDG